MIRIRYTFKAVDGRTFWNDFLSGQSTVESVLIEFKKIGPKYMLQNLIDMRLFDIVITVYKTDEVAIGGINDTINDFIESCKV